MFQISVSWIAHKLGDLLEKTRTVHLIGNLRHDDGVPSALLLLDLALRANGQVTMPRLVRIEDSLATHDDATGGKIRTGQDRHEVLDRAVGVVDHQARRIDGFAEVVRGYVRRHADSDAGRAVDQQVREARGQNLGFLRLSS